MEGLKLNEIEERNRCIKEDYEDNTNLLIFEIHEIIWFLANKYNLTLAEIETIIDNQ